MDDQTKQAQPTMPQANQDLTNVGQAQPVVPAQAAPTTVQPADSADKPSDSEDKPAADPIIVSASEPVAEAPVPEKDLKALSQDLENLAKEVTVPKAEAVSPAVEETKAEEAKVETPAEPPVQPTVEVPSTTKSKILMYTTTACQFCKAQKEYLDKEGLKYEEKNVEEDTAALKEMLNISDNFAGVPVTLLEGPKGKKIVKGFTQDEFIKELENVGLKGPANLADKPLVEAAAPVEVPVAEEPKAEASTEAPVESADKPAEAKVE